ncbi:hypothetical protein [Agrococcus casei]|uniref:Uncharacterized protein n=1 Tax=Agrococcus casei LMG 22410 TaxID=1255656 RepID=A0A1R4GF13_9MICO|nr:hypothetical protein [Agrococcus casei]SJM66791.1 hypothetical protein CZ674_11470 [Agrococcus casei LMG 22410]
MDLRTKSDEELHQLRIDVLTEQERRHRLADIPDQIAQLAHAYEADGGDLADLSAALNKTE